MDTLRPRSARNMTVVAPCWVLALWESDVRRHQRSLSSGVITCSAVHHHAYSARMHHKSAWHSMYIAIVPDAQCARGAFKLMSKNVVTTTASRGADSCCSV
jgi:hypothetical protein